MYYTANSKSNFSQFSDGKSLVKHVNQFGKRETNFHGFYFQKKSIIWFSVLSHLEISKNGVTLFVKLFLSNGLCVVVV